MDRLEELKSSAGILDATEQEVDSNYVLTGEEILITESLKKMFTDIDILMANIAIITESSREIWEIKQYFLHAEPSSNDEQTQGCRLEPVIKFANAKALKTEQILQRRRADYERWITHSDGIRMLSLEILMRDMLLTTATRKFVEVMREYLCALLQYRMDFKKRLRLDVIFSDVEAGIPLTETDPITHSLADQNQNISTLVDTSIAELLSIFQEHAARTERQDAETELIAYQVHRTRACTYRCCEEEVVEAYYLVKRVKNRHYGRWLCGLMVLGVVVGIVSAKLSGDL